MAHGRRRNITAQWYNGALDTGAESSCEPQQPCGPQWVVAAPHPERERLAAEARIAPLVAQILLNRGVRTAAEVAPFLAPDPRRMLPPETLPGCIDAAGRLAAAARARRRIVIYGDYDVDGVTATAILWHALRLAGADVHFYIPSRLEEGYGVNSEALESLAGDGAQVVVTVDCGITAVEPARRARALGLELIITDHHEPASELPAADAIVHPTALGKSPNPYLSGAGVALKIAWALGQALNGAVKVGDAYREFMKEACGFAALGLVADVVALTGENREITSFGLRQLRRTTNPGLKALIDVAGLAAKRSYDDYDVGFLLAPRLNAIGRLGHARLAVELFTRADATRAREIAATLDAHNRQRQEVERQIVRQAEAMVVARGFDRASCRGIVLASPEWHAGVVGIVASRLVERFGRPTVLIALDEETGQGSGRSIRHFPLHEVLGCCGQHLLAHGGHAMAAGVRLRAEQVEAFTQAFVSEANRRLTPADLRPKLRLDDEVELSELTTETVDLLQRLAPFGEGNPRPLLATGVVELAEPPRTCGQNGAHLQFTVRTPAGVPCSDGSGGSRGTWRRVIAFGRGTQVEQLAQQRRIRVAFEPRINEWNGQRRVELKAVDWKPA